MRSIFNEITMANIIVFIDISYVVLDDIHSVRFPYPKSGTAIYAFRTGYIIFVLGELIRDALKGRFLY